LLAPARERRPTRGVGSPRDAARDRRARLMRRWALLVAVLVASASACGGARCLRKAHVRARGRGRGSHEAASPHPYLLSGQFSTDLDRLMAAIDTVAAQER